MADLDRDGNLDHAFLASSGVTVELRNADGSLRTSKQFAVGFTPGALSNHLVAADFNGDGKADLAITYYGDTNGQGPGQGVYVLLGTGGGNFGAAKFSAAGPNPLSLAAGDFNGDGKFDVVVGNVDESTVSVLLGNGDGTFGAPATLSTGAAQSVAYSVLVVDLNGDGKADVVVANRNANSVSVLLNAGGGQFGAPLVTAIPFDPRGLAFADFDHDGKLDIVVACERSNAWSSFCGQWQRYVRAPARTPWGMSRGGWRYCRSGTAGRSVFTGDASDAEQHLITLVSPQGLVYLPLFQFCERHNHRGGDRRPERRRAAGRGGGRRDQRRVGDAISQGGTQFAAPVGYTLGSGEVRRVRWPWRRATWMGMASRT